MTPVRLLTLSPARLASEQRFVAWAAQEERDARRRAWKAAAIATGWLLAGYVLLGISLWVNNPDIGAVAYWSALIVGNIGPVATGFRFWGQVET